MPNNEKYLSSFIRSCLIKDNSVPALQNTNAKGISYKELYHSCFEANYFSGKNDLHETVLIAVYGDKKAEYVNILMSIIASGNAYLPLDYLSPPERLVYILKSSGVKSLVIEKSNSEKLLDYLKEANIEFTISEFSENYLCINFRSFKTYPSDVAYVIYTSGSTGFPKGVVHTHESAMAFINWVNKTFNFPKQSNFISIAPYSFDISVLDVYASLSSGGTLFIPTYSETGNSRFMAQFIAEQEINVLYSTPTFYTSLKLFGKIQNTIYNSVTHLLFAGEQLFYSLVNELSPKFPNAKKFNLYGPTETNVCTYHLIENVGEGPVPIGKACNYAKVHLHETEQGRELWINSQSTMKDYIETPCEFKIADGEKYYNTGDIVVKNSEGLIIYKGRKDRMIKRNGYRIELGEIEHCLVNSKLVDEFLVRAVHEIETIKIIVYYTSKRSVSELELKQYVLLKLPAYMLPDSFVLQDSILKNTNFKLIK